MCPFPWPPVRMPQHVDMHPERQPSSLANPLNHSSNIHPAEGLATLIDEDVSPLNPRKAGFDVPSFIGWANWR